VFYLINVRNVSVETMPWGWVVSITSRVDNH